MSPEWQKTSRGIAILFIGNFEYKIVSTFDGGDGNLIGVNMSLSDCTTFLITFLT